MKIHWKPCCTLFIGIQLFHVCRWVAAVVTINREILCVEFCWNIIYENIFQRALHHSKIITENIHTDNKFSIFVLFIRFSPCKMHFIDSLCTQTQFQNNFKLGFCKMFIALFNVSNIFKFDVFLSLCSLYDIAICFII